MPVFTLAAPVVALTGVGTNPSISQGQKKQDSK